jgi:two-component system, NarL family, response regulator NreC
MRYVHLLCEGRHVIRVLIVDDHQLVRQGILALLIKAKDIAIVGEARDGQEAIDLAQRLQPDVVLMDIEMPRMDGLRATEQLRAQGFAGKVLVLSMRSDEAPVRQALQTGAAGYLIKNSSREDLIAAIRAVHQGSRVSSPEVASFFQG